MTATTPCVVFDVDGTLAEFDADRLGHLVHGTTKHWDAFHHAMADAPPIPEVARLMRKLKEGGETVVICSGRPRGWQDHTIAWLRKHDLPFDGIYLRPEDQDGASDPEVKRRALAEMRADGWRPGWSWTTGGPSWMPGGPRGWSACNARRGTSRAARRGADRLGGKPPRHHARHASNRASDADFRTETRGKLT